MTVAALYVQKNGAYFGLPNVDPWDESRDARTYAGPHPVVAHPPCSRWCQLAGLNQHRWGAMIGDDGGCFSAALASVREHGGVLEHPAFSLAWPAFGLPAPGSGGWQYDFADDSWVCEVAQSAYGHGARKLTWLYYKGRNPPPPMRWEQPRGTHLCSLLAEHDPRPRLTKHAASATPIAFRDLLIAIAESCNDAPRK